MTTLIYERDGHKYEAEVETLPPIAIAYLLQYGWAQSLQDSIAGRAKSLLGEISDSERARLIEAAKPNDPDPELIQLDVDEYMQSNAELIRKQVLSEIEGTLNKRADAIKAGSVGARVSAPRDAFASMCKKVATEMLLAALKAKNTKRPKPDAFEALVVQVLEKHKEKIEVEAKRRIEAANTIGLDVEIEA